MAPGELRCDEAVIDVGEESRMGVSKIVERENNRNRTPPGLGDHRRCDWIAAVGQHDFRTVHIQEFPEESQDSLDLLEPLEAEPGGANLDDCDGNPLPTRIKDLRTLVAADRRPDLVRLAHRAHDVIDAGLALEVELGSTERLAMEAGPGQPREHVERGHRRAVGKVDD